LTAEGGAALFHIARRRSGHAQALAAALLKMPESMHPARAAVRWLFGRIIMACPQHEPSDHPVSLSFSVAPCRRERNKEGNRAGKSIAENAALGKETLPP